MELPIHAPASWHALLYFYCTVFFTSMLCLCFSFCPPLAYFCNLVDFELCTSYLPFIHPSVRLTVCPSVCLFNGKMMVCRLHVIVGCRIGMAYKSNAFIFWWSLFAQFLCVFVFILCFLLSSRHRFLSPLNDSYCKCQLYMCFAWIIRV